MAKKKSALEIAFGELKKKFDSLTGKAEALLADNKELKADKVAHEKHVADKDAEEKRVITAIETMTGNIAKLNEAIDMQRRT